MKLAFPKPKRVRGRGCRVSDRDEAAKQRLGYTNLRSYVRLDGSERLFGEDWKKRKRELWERCGGRCEQMVPKGSSVQDLVKFTLGAEKERCRNEAHDPHHKIERSRKRDDRASNLIGLCRLHHDLLDERKVRWSRAEE